MDEPPVEHLHSQPIVEEDFVIGLAGEVETADGESDLLVVVIGVYEVGRRAAFGEGVGDTLDDVGGVETVAARRGEARVGQVLLVDGEDEAADAGDGLELGGVGGGPGLGVVGADVGEALPGPAGAA